jgi:hypothetical protein
MVTLADDFPLTVEVETGMPTGTDPVTVAFGMFPKLDQKKTREAGHEVYEEVEFIKIRVPGDRFFEYFQPATEGHRRRFPVAYRSFKERTQGRTGLVGLPIDQWPSINRSQAMTLKSAGIHTVEELAAVGEQNVDRLGINGRAMRDTARTYLAAAKDSAETARIAAERDALQAQLKAMQDQINGLTAQGATGNVQPSGRAPVVDDVEQDVVAAARRPRAGSKVA